MYIIFAGCPNKVELSPNNHEIFVVASKPASNPGYSPSSPELAGSLPRAHQLVLISICSGDNWATPRVRLSEGREEAERAFNRERGECSLLSGKQRCATGFPICLQFLDVVMKVALLIGVNKTLIWRRRFGG